MFYHSAFTENAAVTLMEDTDIPAHLNFLNLWAWGEL